MRSPDVVLTRRGPVATITLDRPDVLNALRATSVDQLGEALASTADGTTRAVVLTGRGRAFSSGQDLTEMAAALQAGDPGSAADVARARDGLARLQSLTEQLHGHPAVTIAAVHGVAVGLGAELALACDLRVGGPDTRIGFVEVTRGLFETNGVMWLLPRLIGHARAADLLLTGELVDGRTAHRIGLTTRHAEDGDVAGLATRLADRVAANAPTSTRLLKRLLRRTWDADLPSVMAEEVEGMLTCLASADLREGLDAFVQKRPARYAGA